MSKQRYSEAFLNSNFLDVEKVKVILYNGINVDICNAVNNRVKSLYLDSNFVDEKDGLRYDSLWIIISVRNRQACSPCA